MHLSVVSTLYNSEKNIEEFLNRIIVQASTISEKYEIILVDDGSSDETLSLTRSLLQKHKNIRLFELSKNFGHHRAMMTGLMKATGDYIFLIDSDLDEPPELLSEFYALIQDREIDVVYGCQIERKGKFFERVAGYFAWNLIDLLSEIRIPRNLSTVRLMRRKYVQSLVKHRERKTAIGGLWELTGFKQVGFQFKKNLGDKSDYSFRQRLAALLDSITSFSERPLYFVFFLGVSIFVLSALVALGLIVWRITGELLEGWVSILVSVWLLGGILLLCIGIIGLYISRIFIETKQRPYSIIRNEYNSD
jgi:putative glycosyltransferase